MRAGDHHFGLFPALLGQSGWIATDAVGLPPMGLQDILPTEMLVALVAAILLTLKIYPINRFLKLPHVV